MGNGAFWWPFYLTRPFSTSTSCHKQKCTELWRIKILDFWKTITIHRRRWVELWVLLLSFHRCTWWGCTTSILILKVEAVDHHRITDQAYVNIVKVESASELSRTEKRNDASEEIINLAKIFTLVWTNRIPIQAVVDGSEIFRRALIRNGTLPNTSIIAFCAMRDQSIHLQKVQN